MRNLLRALWAIFTEGIFVDVSEGDIPEDSPESPLPPPPSLPPDLMRSVHREPETPPSGECLICHAKAGEPCNAELHS